MSKLGIHFPNAGFRNLDALWSTPWSSFVVLHLNRDWVPEIRLRYPQARILVRAYTSNWTAIEPVSWAREISLWANELRPFGIEITFANEQNLAAEGHPLAAQPGMTYPPASVYQDILAWNSAVIRELRRLIPWAVIHFPALSQGHSDDQADAGYVGFEILRDAVQMCDVLDAHAYWDESQPGQRTDSHYGERYRMLHSLFPDKPIFISECGVLPSHRGDDSNGIAQWLQALPDYVGGACWFIWDSDDKNQLWILRNKPALAQALRSFQLTTTPQTTPEPIVNPIAIATAFVTGWEGSSATRYSSATGQPAIGYGHLIQQSDSINQSISEVEAKGLLQRDLGECLQTLERTVRTTLTANQKAALLSFVYEVGINALLGSAVLDRLNEADYAGVAQGLSLWGSSDARTTPDNLRRRQLEAELFLRDEMTPAANTSTSPSLAGALLACIISPTATWVSVKQGEHYHVIGVWWYQDMPVAIANMAATSATTSEGSLLVRVENEDGVGIPCELVTRRWDNAQGECEPQFSDPSGMTRFQLSESSRFNPKQERGPDRIHVGDCVISGLGAATSRTDVEQSAVHMIRIRKLG